MTYRLLFDHPPIGCEQWIGFLRSGVEYDSLNRQSAGCDRGETGQRLMDRANAIVRYQNHGIPKPLGEIGIGHRPTDGRPDTPGSFHQQEIAPS